MNRSLTSIPSFRTKITALYSGYVLVAALLLSVALLSNHVIDGIRTFIHAEALWAKGQKNTVLELFYILDDSGPYHVDRYREELSVPLGFRIARVELQGPKPNFEAAKLGFLQGGLDAEGADIAIDFFTRFKSFPYFRDAIEIWTLADEDLAELEYLGSQIAYSNSVRTAEDADRLKNQLEDLNYTLTEHELNFSRVLTEAASIISTVSTTVLVVLSVISLGFVSFFARRFYVEIATALRRERDYLSTQLLAVDTAQMGIFKYESETGSLEANEIGKRMFGLRPDASINCKDLDARLCGEEPDRLSAFICQYDSDDAHDTIEFQVQLANVLRYYKATRRYLHGVDGKGVTYISVLDISDEKNKATMLLEEKAKQEQLFAIIGHELRTPASALRMLIDDQNIKDLEPHGGVIDETVTHLLNVLDDMRTVTRPELVLESPEVVGSVPSVIERSLPLVGRLVMEKELSVTVESSHSSGVYCLIREQLLRQIALILVKNCALHARASELTIQIDAEDLGEEVLYTLSFEDNGVGVSKAVQPRIFEPFERGQTDSDGTGLGLHIARSYARDLLKGDLTYQDGHSGGALFTLTASFPKTSIALENVERSKSTTNSTQALKGLTALYAEDSPVLRMATVKLLEKNGVKVLVGENGREALYLAQREPFDFVLTDIFMPIMDGYKLTANLRREVGFKGPIIGVSAAVVGEESDKLLLAGANAVLPKPIQLADLEAKLLENYSLIKPKEAVAVEITKSRILVIDDDPVTLARFEAVLSGTYDLYTESDALKAVSDFKTLHPDLVFCDVNMPNINGLEVLKQLHSFDPAIPIIQMSSAGEATYYLDVAKTFGARAVLDKSADGEEILRLVHSIFDSN